MILTDHNELIKEALKAREHSYSPYSTFRVGCAILTRSGKIFTGCNVENASYGETVCAERIAIFKAISEGERDFCSACIVGGINEITDYTYPCGSCRQVLSEHCGKDFKIFLYNGTDIKICTLGELFPLSFEKGSIK